MTDDIDDIRKQVQDRVTAEAATLPAPEEKPKITSKLIQECLNANALGDATLYAALFRDRFVYCKDMKEWFEWNGNFWQRDVMDHSHAAVEKVCEQYLNEYRSIGEEIIKLSTARVPDPEAKATEDEEAEESPKESPRVKKLKERQGALLKRVWQLREPKRRDACLKFAHQIEDPLAIISESLDLHPMLFACANGVIDLTTGTLKPGRPGDYLTLASPIEFKGIDEPAPLWEKSLVEISGGDSEKPPGDPRNANAEEMASYYQRLFGYAITGLVKEKIFPVLYGKTGWNGRSLIVDTITNIMGEMAGPIQTEMLLAQKFAKSASGPSPDVMSLKGLRLACASETEDKQHFAASKIKWYTGTDKLVGRWPNDKRQIRFDQTHTLLLMSNYQPSAPPNDKSFWERMHLIPFDISFVNRDPQEAHERRANLDLGKQIRAEYPGILAWLIRGCLLYQRDGLNPPKCVREATEKYRRGEDLLADFIDECCIREPGAKCKSSVLYKRFVEWYHENIGKKEESGTWFGKQISQKFERSKSNGCVVYFGIDVVEIQGGLEAKTDEL